MRIKEVPSTLTDCEAEPINAEGGTPALFKSLFFGAGLCHLALSRSLLARVSLLQVPKMDTVKVLRE